MASRFLFIQKYAYLRTNAPPNLTLCWQVAFRAGRVEVRDLFLLTGSQIWAGQSEAPMYIISDIYYYIGFLFIYRTHIYKSDSYLHIECSCLDIRLLFIYLTPIYIWESTIYIMDSYL